MSTRIKLDSRIGWLIQSGHINNHRSMFVIVGDQAKEQVCCKQTNVEYYYSGMKLIKFLKHIVFIFLLYCIYKHLKNTRIT